MTSDAKIIELGIADVSRIMPLMAQSFDPDYCEAWSQSQVTGALLIPATSLLGVEQKSQMVALALSRTLFDECELLLIAVAQQFRERGVGAALMREVMVRARRNGARKLFLEVRANNPAIDFYAKLHFHQIGVRPHYYKKKGGGTVDAQTMAVDIG